VKHRITRRSVAAGLAAGAFVLPKVGLRTAAAQAKTVKIASIAPLSGPWARQGQLLRMGTDMAMEEINANGGIKSLGGAKVEVISADAGDSTEKAKNAAQRLLADQPELIGGTGSWLSSFTLAVTEVTERAQLPWLTLSYSDAITNRGFKFIFQTSPTADRQAEQTVPTALKLAQAATGKTPKTVGIIMDNTASPVSFAKPLKEGGLEKMGLKLTVDQVYTPPLSDATPLVDKVRSARPDFLLLLTSAMPDCKQVLEKLDEFKLSKGKVPLVGNGAPFGSPELLKTIGPELLEVQAGRERPLAGPGEHDHPHLRIGVQLADRLVERGPQRLGEGVHRLRPIEGDVRDPIARFEQNRFKSHLLLTFPMVN